MATELSSVLILLLQNAPPGSPVEDPKTEPWGQILSALKTHEGCEDLFWGFQLEERHKLVVIIGKERRALLTVLQNLPTLTPSRLEVKGISGRFQFSTK